MESVQTLHDFVLNLLNDPTALTSFAADPQGALSSAGLGDINAADVHDVIPLVVDYAPAQAVSALEAAQSSLSLDGLADSGPAGAIAHLTALTDSLGSADLHVGTDAGGNAVLGGALLAPALGTSVYGAGTIGADGSVGGAVDFASPAAHDDIAVASSASDIQTTAYSAVSDVTGALDSDTINKVTGGELNANALSGAAAYATNLVSDPTSVLSHPTEITNALTGAISNAGIGALPAGDPTGAVSDTLHGLLANVPNPTDLTGTLGNLGGVGNLGGIGGLGNVSDTLGNLTHDPLGAVNQHLPAGVTDLVSGAVSNATSQIPGASDALHSATTELHSTVGDVSGAASSSPLDGLSASSVGDTVSHATSDVTSLVHNVLPLDTDHPLF